MNNNPCKLCGAPIGRIYASATKCMQCVYSPHSPKRDVLNVRPGFLYVCEFTNGWIKVGQTTQLRLRIYQHLRENPQLTIKEVHSFPCENFLADREAMMIAQTGAKPHMGREWFKKGRIPMKAFLSSANTAAQISAAEFVYRAKAVRLGLAPA